MGDLTSEAYILEPYCGSDLYVRPCEYKCVLRSSDLLSKVNKDYHKNVMAVITTDNFLTTLRCYYPLL